MSYFCELLSVEVRNKNLYRAYQILSLLLANFAMVAQKPIVSSIYFASVIFGGSDYGISRIIKSTTKDFVLVPT